MLNLTKTSTLCTYDECTFSGLEDDVTKHMLKKHNYDKLMWGSVKVTKSKIKELACKDCDFKTVSPKNLSIKVTKSKIKELACKDCDFKTMSPKNFSKHIRKHSKDTVCPYCNFRTREYYTLQKHVYRSHKSRNEIEKNIEITIKIYCCNDCGFSDPEKRKFLRHLKSCGKTKPPTIHTKPVLTCPHCEYTTENRGTLYNHERKHTKIRKCPYCYFSATRNCKLQLHVHAKHRELNDVEGKVEITFKVNKCSFCAYSTLDKYSYKKHLEACKKKHQSMD
ncbi:unnamed protein product [Brassicogethes aeneus]|uniref:C2H2-type domain-containing protein n=1 Tax=Brassicogethes aeneus TaxID=1431903 RepID=A0A9P0FEC0_BRAAE|nr:unnamed protein product [Brassicogethes aeneus]